MAPPGVDPKKVGDGARIVWGYKMGQMVSLLIHIGDRLDLFKTMARLGRFVTPAELADHTGYNTRWLLEWLRGMAAAKLLEYEAGTSDTERFRISPEMAEVLANEDTSLNFAAGAFMGLQQPELSDGLVKAFQTGMGMSYRDRSLVTGASSAVGTKRMLGAWTRIALVPQVHSIQEVPGIGCDYFWSFREMSRKQPPSSGHMPSFTSRTPPHPPQLPSPPRVVPHPLSFPGGVPTRHQLLPKCQQLPLNYNA